MKWKASFSSAEIAQKIHSRCSQLLLLFANCVAKQWPGWLKSVPVPSLNWNTMFQLFQLGPMLIIFSIVIDQIWLYQVLLATQANSHLFFWLVFTKETSVVFCATDFVAVVMRQPWFGLWIYGFGVIKKANTPFTGIPGDFFFSFPPKLKFGNCTFWVKQKLHPPVIMQ